jgi:hypothetical protein
METTQNTEVSRVAVRLPPFWAEGSVVWLAPAEAQFALAGISSERTKFHHVISQLDHRYAAEVEDVITSPPQHEPYTKLRTELLSRLSLSKDQRAEQLFELEEMGDRKPSQFLRNLTPDVPDYVLRAAWTSRLPAHVRTTLACHPGIELDTAAVCADRIIESAPRPALASIVQPADNAELLRRIDELAAGLYRLSCVRTELSVYNNV